MNITSLETSSERLRYYARLSLRYLDLRRVCSMFDETSDDHVSRILVINLDRQPARWNRIKTELRRLRCRTGAPLTTIVRRLSATDARHLDKAIPTTKLDHKYTLADQLRVEPNPLVPLNSRAAELTIEMSAQEKAVALSHIDAWTVVANSTEGYTLILEDDIFFEYGFAKAAQSLWDDIRTSKFSPDILYLSYNDIRRNPPSSELSSCASYFLAKPGLWFASGYILSQEGAKKLLSLLPIRGPVDLWLNLQFEKLTVARSARSIIGQKVDGSSTNCYSIMPILTKLGVFNYSSSKLHPQSRLPGPVFAFGEPGSGLSSVAAALSVLGYTCCSDLERLPSDEELSLRLGAKRCPTFNAYVNIGTLEAMLPSVLASLFPAARVIITSASKQLSDAFGTRTLLLPTDHPDKWEALTDFLEIEYPVHPYPCVRDLGRRSILDGTPVPVNRSVIALAHDPSPWTVDTRRWDGIIVKNDHQSQRQLQCKRDTWSGGPVDECLWALRDDTFPGNLALFRPENFRTDDDASAQLFLRKNETAVRSFTSAAIASRTRYRFGRFSIELRPAKCQGVVTGFFLHRNAPRQEIDIEFPGNDTTKMLINVYYNPGIDGTKLEYGYRGTPVSIELGFDANDDYHLYEIEWQENRIVWRVDGCVVHQRQQWNPTPVPDLPMELNANLWATNSRELAGKFTVEELPVTAKLRRIQVDTAEDA